MLNLFIAILLGNFMEARNSIEHDIMIVKLIKKRNMRQLYMSLNTDTIEAH